MEWLGVAAGLQGQADHGVLVDAGQAAGLADADPLVEVGADGNGLVLGEAAVEPGVPWRSRKRCWHVRQARPRRCLAGP